ncbi:C-type lectin domain family 10 member A-like [Protopterus annectens]|uniref:C-type lectin domain family 10 member A-like n=1 Tax=Protopterus annectens TaxID=7888 RepID=UPI001CFC42FE|nr:C-type lectin domain family 10 member A-like [Protopterus annectens]
MEPERTYERLELAGEDTYYRINPYQCETFREKKPLPPRGTEGAKKPKPWTKIVLFLFCCFQLVTTTAVIILYMKLAAQFGELTKRLTLLGNNHSRLSSDQEQMQLELMEAKQEIAVATGNQTGIQSQLIKEVQQLTYNQENFQSQLEQLQKLTKNQTSLHSQLEDMVQGLFDNQTSLQYDLDGVKALHSNKTSFICQLEFNETIAQCQLEEKIRALNDPLTQIGNQGQNVTNLTMVINLLHKDIDDLRSDLSALNRAQTEVSQNLVSVKGKHFDCCPAAWELFRHSCYFFSNNISDWQGSRELCKAMKADLVVINCEQEKEFLQTKAVKINKTLNSSEYYWIRKADGLDEGDCHSTNGTSCSCNTSFWPELKADNQTQLSSGLDDDCVAMTVNEGCNNTRCTDHHTWICERQADICIT